MSPDYNYDVRRTPPAPILPLRAGVPGTEPAVFLAGLVDTGADMTVVPEGVPGQTGLPPVGRITIRGVGGVERQVPVYAAEVDVAGTRRIVEVIGLGAETLIGRDLLNYWILHLDGPRQVLRVTPPRTR